MKKKRKLNINLLSWIFFVVVIMVAYFYFSSIQKKYESVTSFKECVDLGYPVTESLPRECRMPGKTFINENEKTSLEKKEITDELLGKDFPSLSYVVDGSLLKTDKESEASTTTDLVYTPLFYADSLTEDNLPDRLFIAKRNNKDGIPEYFLLLALGLYDGGYASANGVYLGTKKPIAVTKEKQAIKVTFLCEKEKACSQSFYIKNDILEQ